LRFSRGVRAAVSVGLCAKERLALGADAHSQLEAFKRHKADSRDGPQKTIITHWAVAREIEFAERAVRARHD
jgi:hypothetical protein